jgi:hypothetical protein
MSELFDELIAELEASDKPDRRLAAELIALREAVEAAKNELKQINHVNVGGREWAHIKAAYKALDGTK